jgi:hypothetical protein
MVTPAAAAPPQTRTPKLYRHHGRQQWQHNTNITKNIRLMHNGHNQMHHQRLTPILPTHLDDEVPSRIHGKVRTTNSTSQL